MSHIQIIYAFLLFWNIFMEIHRKLLFLVKKLLSQEVAQKYSKSLVFLTSLKRGKSWGKFAFFKQPFLIKQVKKDILTKTVFLLKVIHIQLNYDFLLFWNIFGLIHWKLPFLVKKSDYLRKEHRNTQKVGFS